VPEREQVDVNDIIRDTLALTRGEIARRRVVVRTDLLESAAPIMADRVGLEQVLVNLILNGVDAMDRVAESSRTLMIRSATDEIAGVQIEVQDSGVGVDPEHIARIFDPFFSTKPGGMGMGLAISRSIVETHGGRLWATPNDEAGVTMHVALPAAVAGGQ
jgi:signal transduction histidine kinase